MRKDDIIWLVIYIVFFIIVAGLIITGIFAFFNKSYPYVAGFTQFALFATAGEILSTRILYSEWRLNKATAFKALVWGVSGILVTLAFRIISAGTVEAMSQGILPGYGIHLVEAFFTSCVLNLTFAPIHAAIIRIFGNYGDERFINGNKMTAYESVMSVEWGEFVDFSFFKTIPFFWIPVNTIGFMLPQNMQVAFAAMLSFVFGMLMALLKLREKREREKRNERTV